MASQAAIFAETIAGMKKAVKRKAYDSDSDSSIEQLTNRGNKLRKKARFVHEGQLAPPSGPLVYKKMIQHAGFQREIISRNPTLIDEDGYEVDSDEDDERAETAMAAAAEIGPYSGIQIEHLLAPLTSATDLPHHPTLSKPFNSRTLTELTQQAGEMVQKEKASLWKIKHLLTRLSGDSTWIPCGVVETDNDFSYFNEEIDRQRPLVSGKTSLKDDGDQASTGTLISDGTETPAGLHLAGDNGSSDPLTSKKIGERVTVEGEDVIMTVSADGVAPEVSTNGQLDTSGNDSGVQSSVANIGGDSEMPVNGATEANDLEKTDTAENNVSPKDEEAADAGTEEETNMPAPHRMRTRAQAQAVTGDTPNGTRSATPENLSGSYIHPYFLAARSSRPDRDLGLPANEAEETRRLLQLYIQKQEEVCRGAEKVYNGLLRADRYRRKVMKWAKAEAHVGLNRDMSDGEDWYDKEEWGLDEDLKKGQDEEEEDPATTAKKTRTRRQ